MKKCYLDANILICLKNQKLHCHKHAQKLLNNLRFEGYIFVISPLAIDEFLFQFKYHLSKKYTHTRKIWQLLESSLEDILKLPNLEIVNPLSDPQKQLQVVNLMQKYNLSPRDAYHLFIVLSNNIDAFATFDSDFGKVKEVKIVGLNNSK